MYIYVVPHFEEPGNPTIDTIDTKIQVGVVLVRVRSLGLQVRLVGAGGLHPERQPPSMLLEV